MQSTKSWLTTKKQTSHLVYHSTLNKSINYLPTDSAMATNTRVFTLQPTPCIPSEQWTWSGLKKEIPWNRHCALNMISSHILQLKVWNSFGQQSFSSESRRMRTAPKRFSLNIFYCTSSTSVVSRSRVIASYPFAKFMAHISALTRRDRDNEWMLDAY